MVTDKSLYGIPVKILNDIKRFRPRLKLLWLSEQSLWFKIFHNVLG